MGSYEEIMERYLKDPDIFKVSTKELREWQSEMLQACFRYHYENCADYRKYCDAKRVTPKLIKSLDDASKVPLLDSFETMRKREFLSVPKESIVAKFSSTGTSGKTPLWCSRDLTSIEWQGTAAIRMAGEVADIKAGETLLMVPDMPNVVFSQILKTYLPKVGHKVSIGLRHTMKEGNPSFFPDVEVIKKVLESPAKTKNIVGYPFTIAGLKNFIDKQNMKVSLGAGGTIMCAGGWKAKVATMPYALLKRPALEKLFFDTFGVPPENVKDVYGATELISACWECLHMENGVPVKRKHATPWMYVLILDPDTLEPVERGEVGRAAILDFANHSSPGFILTDDLMKLVSDDGCECGRPGQIVEFVDRVKGTGFRGCAFTVQDKLFSEEYLEEKLSKEVEEVGGLLEYMKKHHLEVGGEFIQANIGDMTRAMETVLDVLKTVKADESLLESIDIVVLTKKFCYKKGEVTYVNQEEVFKAFPNISRKRVLEILNRLVHASLMVKEEVEGKAVYYLTKKADELGSAIFPMIMWALKWSKKEK